jgi:PAS domain S-box-containing protein
MNKRLSVLMVEDNESDIFLMQRILEKGGYEVACEVVDTPGAMRTALLRKKNWDVITSDHSMPNFSSTEALDMAREICPEIPFIILSGEIDINLAVSLMKKGAHDYIQKNEMPLILPAIERALEEVKLRKNQHKAVLALYESEEKFKRLHETAGVGIGYYTPDGVVISYNNLAAQYMGGKPEDYVGKSIYDLFPKASADVYVERLQKAAATDEKQDYEDKVELPKDHKWFLSSFTRILNSTGKVLGVQIISSDITNHKREEESLRESEELFRVMFESSTVGISMVGLDGKYIKVNGTLCNMLGYTKDELMQKNFDEITYSDDKGISDDYYSQLISGKSNIVKFEKRYVRQDGSVIWVLLSSSAIHNKDEKVQYFVTYVQDVSEQKRLR